MGFLFSGASHGLDALRTQLGTTEQVDPSTQRWNGVQVVAPGLEGRSPAPSI